MPRSGWLGYLRTAICVSVLAHLLLPEYALARQSTPSKPPATTASSSVITHYSLPPEKLRQSVELARLEERLYFGEVAIELAALWLILRLRLAAKLRDWAEAASRRRFLQASIFAALALLALAVIELPLHAYGHSLARRYSLSVQGWPSWFLDRAKSELITLFVGALIAIVAWALIRRSPGRWWLQLWLLLLPLIIAGVFAEPLVIEPLFYDFRPLAASHAELTTHIQEIASRAGANIPRERIFEMLASQKLNALNAYVTGIGPSKRVVVWDTLFRDMSDDEILYVVGHELGHYVLNHVWKGIAVGYVVLFFGLWILWRVQSSLLRRRAAAWKIRAPDDLAALASLLLVFSILDFAVTPFVNATSRYIEHQADVFGLEVIHGVIPNEHQVAAHSEQILGKVDLEEPDPSWFTVFWFDDHPPIAQRLDFALHYDPWTQGRSPQFIH